MIFPSLKEKRGQKRSLSSAPSLSAPARSCDLGLEEGGFALHFAGAHSSLTLLSVFAGSGPGLAVPDGRHQAAPNDAFQATDCRRVKTIPETQGSGECHFREKQNVKYMCTFSPAEKKTQNKTEK